MLLVFWNICFGMFFVDYTLEDNLKDLNYDKKTNSHYQ